MKKYMILLLALTAGLSACQRETFDERVKRELDEFTAKQCPRQLDEYMIELSREYKMKGRELVYTYEVIGEADNKDLYTDELRRDAHDNALKSIRYDLDLKVLKDSAVTFVHIYKSRKTGKVIFTDRFCKEEYDN